MLRYKYQDECCRRVRLSELRKELSFSTPVPVQLNSGPSNYTEEATKLIDNWEHVLSLKILPSFYLLEDDFVSLCSNIGSA